MKKPVKPRKPTLSKKPELNKPEEYKTAPNYRFTIRTYTSTDLHELINRECKNNQVKIEGGISSLSFKDIKIDLQWYYGDTEIELIINKACTYLNQSYIAEMYHYEHRKEDFPDKLKKWEKRQESYENKLEKYNLDMIKYEEDLKKYHKWEDEQNKEKRKKEFDILRKEFE